MFSLFFCLQIIPKNYISNKNKRKSLLTADGCTEESSLDNCNDIDLVLVGVFGDRGPLDVGELAIELPSSSFVPKYDEPVFTTIG